MRTEIKPGQDSDYTGYDLVMADNLPQPAVLVLASLAISPALFVPLMTLRAPT